MIIVVLFIRIQFIVQDFKNNKNRFRKDFFLAVGNRIIVRS